MSTTDKTAARPMASFAQARLSAPRLLQLASSIVASMRGNPAFPSPAPPLTAVSAAIDALTTAEVAAATRTRGTTAVRDEKRLALVELLEALTAHVQLTADADPASAAAIIESAGLRVRKRRSPEPRVFSLRQGPVSGTVNIVAPSAGDDSSYQWQYSLDGGAHWVDASPTKQAQTSLEGLAPRTEILVRYRPVTRKEPADWSAAVGMTVL